MRFEKRSISGRCYTSTPPTQPQHQTKLGIVPAPPNLIRTNFGNTLGLVVLTHHLMHYEYLTTLQSSYTHDISRITGPHQVHTPSYVMPNSSTPWCHKLSLADTNPWASCNCGSYPELSSFWHEQVLQAHFAGGRPECNHNAHEHIVYHDTRSAQYGSAHSEISDKTSQNADCLAHIVFLPVHISGP